MANRQGFQIERVPMKNTHHEKKYELLVSNSERIAWAAWGQAELGVFLCFEEPTKPMLREAAEAGLYKSSDGTTYPRMQILTIQQILDGRQPEYPLRRRDATFKKAPRSRPAAAENLRLPLLPGE